MNFGNISDQLPVYPNNIQGELRIILQTKDVFLVCYKHLEEYRRLVNEQNRLITKEFVQEQLQIGEDEISELKMELQDAESRLSARLKHNELLADHLGSLGFGSLESGASIRHLALCRSPQMRKNMLAQRQGANSAGGSRFSDARPPTHMIDNIALAIAEIHQEVRAKVKPLLDYYRDLFYLQLHFSLVLGQVCNYCMPLVTENIGLIDRIFFWSERPEFDLVRRAGDIGDRLKEIYTRAQTVLSVLTESVRFLQSKVDLQKTLEQRFHERLDEQQKTKDKILREVHTTKQNMDMLEEENDRLVGSLVKVDPSFVDSRHFFELAEGGSLMGAKKPNIAKETGQHNAEDRRDTINSVSGQDEAGQVVREALHGAIRRAIDANSPSCIENPSNEINNNKANSLVTELGNLQVKRKVTSERRKPRHESNSTKKNNHIKPLEANKKVKQHTKTSNGNNISDSSDGIVFSQCEVIPEQRGRRSREVDLMKSTENKSSKHRSKSRQRESSPERPRRTSIKEQRSKTSRRATSADKGTQEYLPKKHRPKSSVGIRQPCTNDKEHNRKLYRSATPIQSRSDIQLTSSSTAAGDTPQIMNHQQTLKSKLLGRTKDLLDAALHRTSKSSSLEQFSATFGEIGPSMNSGRVEGEDNNNDAITSVSSFASIFVPDTPPGKTLTEIEAANIIPPRQLRTLEPRKKNRLSPKISSKRKSKQHLIEYDAQLSPKLSDDMLLIQTPTDSLTAPTMADYTYNNPSPKTKRSKSKKDGTQARSNVGDFLSGTCLGPLPSVSSN